MTEKTTTKAPPLDVPMAEAETKDGAEMSGDSIIAEFPQTRPFDEHNQALIANIHPTDWTNPEPDGAAVDFGSVMERMRKLPAGISPKDSASRFRELGVDVFIGDALSRGSIGPSRILRMGLTLIVPYIVSTLFSI